MHRLVCLSFYIQSRLWWEGSKKHAKYTNNSSTAGTAVSNWYSEALISHVKSVSSDLERDWRTETFVTHLFYFLHCIVDWCNVWWFTLLKYPLCFAPVGYESLSLWRKPAPYSFWTGLGLTIARKYFRTESPNTRIYAWTWKLPNFQAWVQAQAEGLFR